MSETKTPRPIAGDGGTTDRMEADDGHYWVRLWSRQAIRREGEAMRNCLRDGRYDKLAGSEDPLDHGLWNLRDPAGASIALAEAKVPADRDAPRPGPFHILREFLGVKNAMASGQAYRQLRHLAAAFETFGTRLEFLEHVSDPVVVAPDGRTFRWDRAPAELRRPDHDERMAARVREQEARQRRNERAALVWDNQPPIPDGALVCAYVGDGLDPDQPMFGVQAGLVGDPIEFTDGITLIARTNGRFRAMIQTDCTYRIIENASLYPVADLDAASPDSARIEDVPSREWPRTRSVIFAGAEAFTRLSATLPDPEATDIQFTIGVDLAQGNEPTTVVDWCNRNLRLNSMPIRGRREAIREVLGPQVVAQDVVRYEPATEYRGMLPDGLLYARQHGPSGTPTETIIVTANDGWEVTAIEVYANGRIALEFAPQEFVEIRTNQLPGNPVIDRYPVPATPGRRRHARIVSDHRVDDWRGVMP